MSDRGARFILTITCPDTTGIVATGRDVESITLSRAIKYHLEHKVFLNGNKTVVFQR